MSQFLEIELDEEEEALTNSQIEPKVKLENVFDNLQNQLNPNAIFDELMKNIYVTHDVEKQRINMEKSLVAVESNSENESKSEENEENEGDKNKKKKRKRKKIICPKYKIIEGSLFAVDAFRYGEITHVEHYFLTHFHGDHYIGLRKKFQHKIYLSEITAKLVKAFIGVSEEYLEIVHIDVPFFIDDVRIIPLDANHCPGALLFLFQFPDGRQVLHVGDFRANDEMVQKLLHFGCTSLDLVYLDTTYLHTKRRMPPQSESIEYLLTNVQKYLENNIGEKFLILVGAYLIGKERVWMAIAEKFNFKVFLQKERYKAFVEICSSSVYYFEFYKKYITVNENEADIRVVNMLQVSYPNLRDFLRDNQDTYNTILGVVASGWENQKFSSGRISLLHVQYSEHSSYDELEKFIVNTKPKNVISTVPIRMNSAITAEIPNEWMSSEKRLRKKKTQKKLLLKRN
jgi:DNA cross-link repair 1A protein